MCTATIIGKGSFSCLATHLVVCTLKSLGTGLHSYFGSWLQFMYKYLTDLSSLGGNETQSGRPPVLVINEGGGQLYKLAAFSV